MKRYHIVMAALAIVLLAGCGPLGPSGTPVPVEGTPVVMKDSMDFEPDTLTVKAGQEVQIGLVNQGNIKHNFAIPEIDLSVDLNGKRSREITFTAPTTPGEYPIVCDIPGHAGAGMVGKLIVEP